MADEGVGSRRIAGLEKSWLELWGADLPKLDMPANYCRLGNA